MTQTLHILTACSRPEGLAPIAAALRCATDLRIVWHVSYDIAQTAIGGHAIKNHLLDNISDGWVWLLDDDNLPHPDFFTRLPALLDDPGTYGYVFGQDRGRQGYVPPVIEVGRIDAAQIVIRRDAVGAMRLPEIYEGDGQWITALYRANAGMIVLINEALTYYNRQRWV